MKSFSKIIFILISLLILLISSNSYAGLIKTEIPEGYYYFTIEGNVGPFVDAVGAYQYPALCEAGKIEYQKKNPQYKLTVCTNKSLVKLAEEIHEVEAKKESENTNTDNKEYKLLAPIGELKTAPDNIGDYFNTMFEIAIGICAVLAVVMIVIGGIQYMGNESIFGKAEAKTQIWHAILGLLIALASFALLNTIDPALLGINGVSVKQVSAEIGIISREDTSTGSSTNPSLCISKTNPPDPTTATGSTMSSVDPTYRTALNKVTGVTLGRKLLAAAQTKFEGFSVNTKSYKTNNPGNIGNTDDGKTKTFATLEEGIEAQFKKVISGQGSYILGKKYPCALGDEKYEGYLYQYLRIYATGARFSNNYLNAVIGYFKYNGRTITAKTTMDQIYNMK